MVQGPNCRQCSWLSFSISLSLRHHLPIECVSPLVGAMRYLHEQRTSCEHRILAKQARGATYHPTHHPRVLPTLSTSATQQCGAPPQCFGEVSSQTRHNKAYYSMYDMGTLPNRHLGLTSATSLVQLTVVEPPASTPSFTAFQHFYGGRQYETIALCFTQFG